MPVCSHNFLVAFSCTATTSGTSLISDNCSKIILNYATSSKAVSVRVVPSSALIVLITSLSIWLWSGFLRLLISKGQTRHKFSITAEAKLSFSLCATLSLCYQRCTGVAYYILGFTCEMNVNLLKWPFFWKDVL